MVFTACYLAQLDTARMHSWRHVDNNTELRIGVV
jgi:hypothetical protein